MWVREQAGSVPFSTSPVMYFFEIYLYLFCVCECYGTYMEVRGQLEGVDSLLLSCGPGD